MRGDAKALGPSRLRRSLARSLAQIRELARRLVAQWFEHPTTLNDGGSWVRNPSGARVFS